MMAYRNFKVLPKCVNVDPSGIYHLSPEEIQFYKDNGYLVVKKLIDQSALDSYRERFVDLCTGRLDGSLVTFIKDYTLSKKSSNPEHYINKIQDLLYDKVFSTYSENPRLLHVVSQLIGNDLTAANSMLINKPPGTNMHAPHQDLFYLPFRPAHQILVAWTAIDPARKDNGCLFMIPGSHKANELLEHTHDINDGKQFYFSVKDWETIAPEEKRVYLEMDPGDTVFISTDVIHGSMPNVTKMYRKCMTCHFANSHCKYIDVNDVDPILSGLIKKILKQTGCEFNYVEVWKAKTKVVKGVRCNL